MVFEVDAHLSHGHHLLAGIFGDSPPAAPPTQPGRGAVDDIMSLFGPGPTSNASAPPPAAANPLFSMQRPSPAPAPAQQPQAQARAPGYVAYDKNGLRIALAPQTNPARPGVVLVLVRFEATGMGPVSGVNFQAAVPKVKLFLFDLWVYATDAGPV